MSQKQIVCGVCKSSPTIFSSLLTKVDCCKIYICRVCRISHTCLSSLKSEPLPSMNMCYRCWVNPVSFECTSCANGFLCTECDELVHGFGKFHLHERKSADLKEAPTSQSINEYLSVSQGGKKVGILSERSGKTDEIFQNAMVCLNISQTWDKVKKEMQSKFTELLNELGDRQAQLASKIEQRKQKDLKNYRQLFVEYQEMSKKGLKKSIQIDKLETLRNKLKHYQNYYIQGQDGTHSSKYSLNSTHFDSIHSVVEKIDLNTLILKVSNKQDHTHRSKRNSMMFGSVTPGGQGGSYFRSPKNNKSKLSISTLQVELKEAYDHVNEEDELGKVVERPKKKPWGLNSSKMLGKVKSQKKICKSPTNLKLYFGSGSGKGF